MRGAFKNSERFKKLNYFWTCKKEEEKDGLDILEKHLQVSHHSQHSLVSPILHLGP
jgi:hypothetical protein